MKIILVAESGVYDHWRKVFEKHTKLLAKAVGVKTDDLPTTRLDDADVIIYFDSSSAGFYSHIAMDVGMINHAALMGVKGIKALIVTKNGNPGEVVYRVWYSGSTITEVGQIGEMWYAFHSNEVSPVPVSGSDGFVSMDWAEFEKRFVLGKK